MQSVNAGNRHGTVPRPLRRTAIRRDCSGLGLPPAQFGQQETLRKRKTCTAERPVFPTKETFSFAEARTAVRPMRSFPRVEELGHGSSPGRGATVQVWALQRQ